MLAIAAMPQCWSTETEFLWKRSTVIHQMQVPPLAGQNAGSLEMYNVLKKMKTVLKRVNSTAFEICFSAYLVKLNIFAHIRTVIRDSFK